MAKIRFYEKPDCINNAKQRQLLIQSGHKVIRYDLLLVNWDALSLRRFFGDLPVANWFNYNAPAIKYGWIEPEVLDEPQALSLMISDPILIRRPLMQVDNQYMVGFDMDIVDKWIDPGKVGIEAIKDMELECCTQQRRVGYAE